MTTRIALDDHDEAVTLAKAIELAGHEVVLITERAGDDHGSESYLVATPASRDELGGLVPEELRPARSPASRCRPPAGD